MAKKKPTSRPVKRRWRDYETAAGNRPVKKFIDELDDGDAANIVAAMRDVAEVGDSVARHLQGEIWEVRAEGERVIYRVLYASVGRKGRILLALEAFKKKTQKTPPPKIDLAERRLRDWNRRGNKR